MLETEANETAARERRLEAVEEVKDSIEKVLNHIELSLTYLRRILSGLVRSVSSKTWLTRTCVAPAKLWWRESDITEEQMHIQQLCRGLDMLLHSLDL